MKVFLLVVLLALGSQASFLDSLKETFHHIGDAFTQTFSQVGEQAKTTGQQLLDQLKQQGTALAGQALQSLLLGATSALTPSTDGKREINLDPVILEELKNYIEEKLGKYQYVYNAAIDTLAELGTLKDNHDLLTLVSKVDEVVHTHHAVANNVLHELVEGLQAHFSKVIPKSHKRTAFSDLLGQVGQSLAQFFQPHIEAAKQVVSALGQGVKETAQQTGQATHDHLSQISTSGHTIVQHGQNALSALKDAVTDILHQTLTNIQPHISNIVTHATQLAAQSGPTLVHTLGHHIGLLLGSANTQQ